MKLYLQKIDKNGHITDYGMVCDKLVTEGFANFVAGALAGSGSITDFNYHDTGTGTTEPAESDTALENATGMAKVAGSQSVAGTGNVYVTEATITYDADYTITEHGVFNAADLLMDRSTFSGKSVSSGDKLKFTYTYTVDYGG